MRLFLDTNIVIDYLTARNHVDVIDKIFAAIDEGIHVGVISIGSYYTITYIMERFLKDEGLAKPYRLVRLRELLSELLASLEIAGHTRAELLSATNNQLFTDLEDSFQLQAAQSSSCSYLITNNIKDFPVSHSETPKVVTPQIFLEETGLH